MIERWFQEQFTLSRRDDSDDWTASPFVEVGKIRGYSQPAGGGMATKNGAVNANATYTLYCAADSGVIMGDRITDSAGRNYIVIDSQPKGIVGQGRHIEAVMEIEKA